MPYQPKVETIKKMISEVYKELVAKQITTIANRINRNNNVGNLDTNPRVQGDTGYLAYKKLMIFTNTALTNPFVFIEKFSNVYMNFTATSDIREQLNNVEADSNDTTIQDFFLNDPQMIYDLAGIVPSDLN